jgi:hypothetical protein
VADQPVGAFMAFAPLSAVLRRRKPETQPRSAPLFG